MNKHIITGIVLSSIFLSVLFTPPALANSRTSTTKSKDEIFLNSIEDYSQPYINLGLCYEALSENDKAAKAFESAERAKKAGRT